MFNPFECLSCYMNDGCEILDYSLQEDCNWIDQKTRSTLSTVKYWVKDKNNSYIDQFKTEQNKFAEKTIFINNTTITDTNKLRIDWVVYDIVWVNPVRIANSIFYLSIDVQVWDLS